MSLDRYQTSAVEFAKGPALVVAGPGSGKTTVLTRRVEYLINQRNVSPHRILVITFTKAAAVQMKDRFNTLSNEYNPVTFCTFHSLFYTIIKDSDYNHYSVISPEEKLNICKSCMLDNNVDIDSVSPVAMLDEFAKINNSKINPVDYESSYVTKDVFLKIYFQYKREKEALGKIEFDDFADIVNRLLMNDSILTKWQNMYDYVLIDEFQDINLFQYEIIKKLFISNNIYAVGDEDQSIYGFRGSSPDICFKFINDYDATKFELFNNYRSSKIIVDRASNLIKNNKNRFDKTFNAINDNKGDFNMVRVNDYNSLYKEMAIDILDKIKEYKSIVILTRTNVVPEGMLRVLNKYGINTDRSNIKIAINGELLKTFIAYFNLSTNIKNVKDLLLISNKPDRYISRTFINMLLNECGENFDFTSAFKLARGKGYLVKSLFILERNLIELNKMDSYEGIIYIMKVIGYEGYLKKKHISYEEDMKLIKEYAREFRDKDDFAANINLLRECNTTSNYDSKVEIRTMHSSKGLEWDQVYITELQEGQIPHRKCINIEELEEERRLLYVAMTRAKEGLWLGYVDNKEMGIRCSKFVEEI